MADKPGIILQHKLKADASPISGEMEYTTDTQELAVQSNGVVKFRSGASIQYNVYKGTGVPDLSLGENGDVYYDDSSHTEYYKFGVWVPRVEGKDRAYYLGLWEQKLTYPSNGLKRDGSVNLQPTYDQTDDGVVSKDYIDTKVSFLTDNSANLISPDGTKEMLPGYSPTLAGDVIDKKALEAGEVYLYPPTIMPLTPGIVWNDNGTPKIETEVQTDPLIPNRDVQVYGEHMVAVDGKLYVNEYQYVYIFDVETKALLGSIDHDDYTRGCPVNASSNGIFLVNKVWEADGTFRFTPVAPVGYNPSSVFHGNNGAVGDDFVMTCMNHATTYATVMVFYDTVGNFVKIVEDAAFGSADLDVYRDHRNGNLFLKISQGITSGDQHIKAYSSSGTFLHSFPSPEGISDFGDRTFFSGDEVIILGEPATGYNFYRYDKDTFSYKGFIAVPSTRFPKASFAGISFHNGKLYYPDQVNYRVAVIDIETDKIERYFYSPDNAAIHTFGEACAVNDTTIFIAAPSWTGDQIFSFNY